MTQGDKLLERIRNNKKNVRLDDAIRLAEKFGFERRNGGKHANVLKRPDTKNSLNFQERGGFVKPYQVQQLLDAIELIETDRK